MILDLLEEQDLGKDLLRRARLRLDDVEVARETARTAESARLIEGGMAELVVGRALLGIGENGVSLGKLLKLLLGFLVALVLLIIPIRDTPAILAFSVWVALVSLALLIRRSRIETQLES